jgi:hypothetical protein
MQADRNAMADCGHKIGERQWFALVVGNGNQRHFAKSEIEGLEIPQILPTSPGNRSVF